MNSFFPCTGIIAEYNPFHNGHAWHVDKTRAKTNGQPIVAVMSGSFVQRGEPALLTKWKRAEMAVCSGIDLVMELPLPWSMSPAAHFARGGVALLRALGCVDKISFGCETDDVHALLQLAEILSSPAFQTEIRSLLPTGETFARLRLLALKNLGVDSTPLERPNNILAVEYMKANLALRAGLQPVAISRKGAGHDAGQPTGSICSASYLREHLWENEIDQYMPESAFALLQDALATKQAPATLAALERSILTVLRRMTAEQFSLLPDVSEGLHNRLHAAVQSARSLDEVFTKTKTKRYTLARIRRIVLSAFLEIPSGIVEKNPPYLRVLAYSETGKRILAQARTTAKLPIIMRYADIKKADPFAQEIFRLENRAGNLYGLACPSILPPNLDATSGQFDAGV